MDQNDNRHKQILWRLLANPADTGQLYITNLEQMVNEYPQSGLLRVLLERATDKRDVKNAAVYFKTGTLYKLLHNPDSLQAVAPHKIIGSGLPGSDNSFSIPVMEDTADHLQENTPFTTPETIAVASEVESATTIDEETQDEIQGIDTIIPELYNSYTEQAAPTQTNEMPVNETEREPITSEPLNSYKEELAEEKKEGSQSPTEGPAATFTNLSADNGYREEKEYFRQDIEDEIYDEIVSIDDIGFEPVVNVLHETEEQSDNYTDDEDYPADEEEEDERPLQKLAGITDRDVTIDEEKLILGNIVSADYLTFDKKLDELRNADNFSQQSPATAEPQQSAEPIKESPDTLSRYNDETLPYSFMWWLDKTRKEHAGSFQPYAANPVPAPPATENTSPDAFNNAETVKPVKRAAPDELQQQYYENIFSITSVSGIESGDSSKGIAFDHNKKEDIIIERFIHNEPQIRPPAADKLDNENKAKKSSEDQDVLVTETLARIYTDQMLYHKAIATYKKLILKFPEKKLYFATQIEQLEKKTN